MIMKGDSWHFMGIPQMTRRYAWAWYTMLKAAHANAVRLHAQPYPSFYLDMADEMGILVLDETAMWASDGGPDITSEEYWNNAADHLRDLIRRDRNHPSVFGFSVCNENIPVAVNVFHAPEPLVQRQLAEIDRWVSIVKDMDPTRPWISGDGETGKPTNLPILIGHYGGEAAYKEWSSGTTPWGIGESGMAYYGTPRQTAAYNGEASYVSPAGRMEGVADEARKLANAQKRYQAVYRSIFNLVWYGLQPLELGLSDTTRAPMPDDGIFFPPFKEGQPGVQPERLGPYTTTLNPGYDPRLPLYRPWPLFTVLADALADTAVQADPPQPEVFERRPSAANATSSRGLSADADRTAASIRVLSADTALLDTLLRAVGATIAASPVDGSFAASSDGASEHILIDGIHPPEPAVLASVLAAAGKGASVLVWGIRPSTVASINAVLPEKLIVTDRKATSYIPTNGPAGGVPADGTLGGNADWYFSELSKLPVSDYALSGGRVLLAACQVDWQRWNGRPEYSKTIAILRSEREAKPAGNVLVSYPVGKGRVDVFTIDPLNLYKVSRQAMRNVLEYWGVRLRDSAGSTNAALNVEGWLIRAMVNGVLTSTLDAPAQVSFWVYSPRSLVNLLVEPDIPTVKLTVHGSADWQVRVNDSPAQAGALPLQKGWNHLVIDIRKRTEEPLRIQLSSDHSSFLSTLRSNATAADTDSTPQ